MSRDSGSDYPSTSYLQWFVPDDGWLAPELQAGIVTGLSFGPSGRLLVTWREFGKARFRAGWIDSP